MGKAVGFYTGKPIPRLEALNHSSQLLFQKKSQPSWTSIQDSFPAQGKSHKSYSTKMEQEKPLN